MYPRQGLLRRRRRAALRGTVLLLLCGGAANATPLVWAEDASPVSSSRGLVWVEDTPESASSAAAASDSVEVIASPAGGASGQELPESPPGQDLQPNGYPRYGVPVEASFPPAYIGGAMPSAYIAGWSSYYFGLSGGTPGKLRSGGGGSQVDASFNTGIGFGDFFKTVALQVDWGIGSIANFGNNGGFSFSAGRLLVDQPRFQMAAAGGVFSFYTYGNEGNPEPASGYGVLTLATPLRYQGWDFQQVLQLSLGYGGWQFAYLDPVSFESDDGGIFAALGLQITKNVGLSASWSPRGTNVNLSYSPFRDLPIYFNLLGADLGDVSPWGPRAVFSVTWGDDFRTALF